MWDRYESRDGKMIYFLFLIKENSLPWKGQARKTCLYTLLQLTYQRFLGK